MAVSHNLPARTGKLLPVPLLDTFTSTHFAAFGTANATATLGRNSETAATASAECLCWIISQVAALSNFPYLEVAAAISVHKVYEDH